MTLVDAHDTARTGAERDGNTWRVFRLPAWPGGVYTASAKDPPSEAHVVGTYPQSKVTSPKVVSAPAPRVEPQGSLF